MRFVFIIIMLFSCIASAQELTFSQAVEEMIQQNPSLAQRKLETQASRNDLFRSKASYWPQIDFLQTWNHSNNPVYVFGSLLNQQRFSESNFAIASLNNPDPLTDFSSRFQLGWLLYDFGKRESQVDSAESGYRIASFQEQSEQIHLLNELVRRYYGVSLANQKVAVARQAVTSAESSLQQSKDRVTQGLVVLSDQLAAEVYHARRLQEEIDARNQAKLAVAALNELLGRDEEQEVTTSTLEDRDFPLQPLSWWQNEMEERRPELKMTDETAKMAHSQVRVQQSQFLPSIQLWSNYEWHGEDLDYSGNNWGAGVELRWNLFRGFADRLQLSSANLQQQSATQKRRQTQNALSLQLKQAYFSFESAKEKLGVARTAVDQAAENKRIYADRYTAGFVTIQDRLQAETAYNEARLMYTQNIYDLYVSYASLLAAAGKMDEIQRFEVR